MLVSTRCKNYALFHFSASAVCVQTCLFILRSTCRTTGGAPCFHDSQVREVRRNQRSQWRHNNYMGCSWRSLLYSKLFAYIRLSKWHSLKMKHSCGRKRMSWCTSDAKCEHHNDSRGCVDLSSQTANSSSDTDTNKRRQAMPMVLKKNKVISKNTVFKRVKRV